MGMATLCPTRTDATGTEPVTTAKLRASACRPLATSRSLTWPPRTLASRASETASRMAPTATSWGSRTEATTMDASLKGLTGVFTDGAYGYLVAYKNRTGYLGKVARFSLRTFGDVQVLDVDETDVGLKGFRAGFTDGIYAYLVPYKNSRISRFQVGKTKL